MKGPNWRSQQTTIGGFVGVVFASWILALYHQLTEPQLFNDGLYFVLFAVSSPPGWLVGSLVSHFKTRKITNDAPYGAGVVIAGGAMASFFLGPFIGMIAMLPIGAAIEIFKALF
jgi:hypothetical protein